MCTALSLNTRYHYFGRTLDIDRSYGEEVCILPRSFPIIFSEAGELKRHSAIIGMASVANGTPLFYDAVNEHGLAMAGLSFPENACYFPPTVEKRNVASYELISLVLCQCKSTAEAEAWLSGIVITDARADDELPTTPLHWMVSDERESIVVEQTADGLCIYPNAVGVLANNPPFPAQLEGLKEYEHLTNDNGRIRTENALPYSCCGNGLGAVGLPGDTSSSSRFVRAAFGRKYSVCDEDEIASVGQFFHLMSSVEVAQGLCRTDDGAWNKTVYTSCINTAKGRYYYTTYGNRRISCVDMHKTDLDSQKLTRFPISNDQSVRYIN